MATRSKALLKPEYVTDKRPKQVDFHDWIDSYWHVSEPIQVKLLTGTEYDADGDADTGGVLVGEYYIAGENHEDGVRWGTPCRRNV